MFIKIQFVVLLSIEYHQPAPSRIPYNDVIMSAMASQITSLTIVCSTVYSGGDQTKHQISASLAFVRGIHRGPVNSPHKGSVTRKMFPFDHVIMTKCEHGMFAYKYDHNVKVFCLVPNLMYCYLSFNMCFANAFTRRKAGVREMGLTITKLSTHIAHTQEVIISTSTSCWLLCCVTRLQWILDVCLWRRVLL